MDSVWGVEELCFLYIIYMAIHVYEILFLFQVFDGLICWEGRG